MDQQTLQKLVKVFDMLAARWEDERGMEPFDDYRKRFKSDLPKGATFVQMEAEPFRAVFNADGFRHTLRATPSKIMHDRVKL